MRAGYVRGRHYTDYVEVAKDLKRQGRLAKLEELLRELIDAVEAEARKKRWAVAPWYYYGGRQAVPQAEGLRSRS